MSRVWAARAATAVLILTATAPAFAQVSFELVKPPSWAGVPADAPAGSTFSMLYPAPTPLAGLVGVLVHGALSSGIQQAEQRQRQQDADAVFAAERPALEVWAMPPVTAWISERLSGSMPASSSWRLQASPSFAVHADRQRLDLSMPTRVTTTATGQTVDVFVLVADRREAPLAPADAEGLKAQAQSLLAHGASVALLAASLPPDNVQRLPTRTHRFPMGEAERMERGQLVARSCGRLLLLNLRGQWMSVPASSDSASSSTDLCEAGATPRWRVEESLTASR